MNEKFPRGDGLNGLPVMSWRKVLHHYGRPLKRGEDPGQALVETGDFIELVRQLAGVRLDERSLRGYASQRVGVIEPPVRAGRRACFVFPRDFDRLAIVLILRQDYHLPLETIRTLLTAYPREHYGLLIERKLSVEDLLELVKMFALGFGVRHAVMAKAFDAALLDLGAGADAGEERLLARLDEMKDWVRSGGWRDYVKRQAELDLKDLSARRKVLAKARIKVGRRRVP